MDVVVFNPIKRNIKCLGNIGITISSQITNPSYSIKSNVRVYLAASRACKFALATNIEDAKKELMPLKYLVPHGKPTIWKYTHHAGKLIGFGTLIEPCFRLIMCNMFKQAIVKSKGGLYSTNCNFLAEADGMFVKKSKSGSTLHLHEYKSTLKWNQPKKFKKDLKYNKFQLACLLLACERAVDITIVMGFWKQLTFKEALNDFEKLVIYYIDVGKFTFKHCLETYPNRILYFEHLIKLPKDCNEKIKDPSFIKNKKFLCYKLKKVQYKTFTRKDLQKEMNFLKQKFENVKKGKI